MSSNAARPRPAAIIPLEDLRSEHAGSKVRVAGFLTAYDAESRLGFVSHKATLLVDFTYCEPPPLKEKVMVLGDLESSKDVKAPASIYEALVETIPRQSEPSLPLILRALVAKECHGLDFEVWNEAARTESQARWREYEEEKEEKAGRRSLHRR